MDSPVNPEGRMKNYTAQTLADHIRVCETVKLTDYFMKTPGRLSPALRGAIDKGEAPAGGGMKECDKKACKARDAIYLHDNTEYKEPYGLCKEQVGPTRVDYFYADTEYVIDACMAVKGLKGEAARRRRLPNAKRSGNYAVLLWSHKREEGGWIVLTSRQLNALLVPAN